MKAHYPVEFLAASMTYDMSNTDKLNDFRREAVRLGIEVVTPSVNTSYRLFEVGENRIYYSLAAIKGVGEAAVDHIVEKRGATPYASLEDFCERIDPRVVNRRVFESLINAGAFDCFGRERPALIAGLDRIIGHAQRTQEDSVSGQADIFGGMAGAGVQTIQLPAAAPWLSAEKLRREFEAAGFYLSAHPLDEYRPILEKMRVQTWAEFSAAVKRGANAGRLAGTITAKQERKTKTGNKMGIIQFSDSSGQFEAVLFSEALAQYRDLLEPGRSVVVTVGAEDRPEGISLRIQTAQSLEDEATRMQKALRLYMRSSEPLGAITPYLAPQNDGQVVSLILIKENGATEVEIELPNRYRVGPQIASAMKAIPGIVEVEMG